MLHSVWDLSFPTKGQTHPLDCCRGILTSGQPGKSQHILLVKPLKERKKKREHGLCGHADPGLYVYESHFKHIASLRGRVSG